MATRLSIISASRVKGIALVLDRRAATATEWGLSLGRFIDSSPAPVPMQVEVRIFPNMPPLGNSTNGLDRPADYEVLFTHCVNHCCPEIRGIDRQEAVRELVAHEKWFPVVAPEGIAFPHAKLGSLSDAGLCIVCACRFGRPVVWPGGGPEVYLAWLMLEPFFVGPLHPQLLGRSAEMSQFILRSADPGSDSRRAIESLGPEEFADLVCQAFRGLPETNFVVCDGSDGDKRC